MSDRHPIGPKRDPRPPAFNTEDERLALQQALVTLGVPTPRAKVLVSRETPSSLAADPQNGDALWTDDTGRVIRGEAGRFNLAERLAKRERMQAFGPDPLEKALRQLAQDWGIPEHEARPRLEHRLRRQEDGSVTYSPSPGERLRIGGMELVDEAIERTVADVRAARAGRSAAQSIEAEVRARHHFTA